MASKSGTASSKEHISKAFREVTEQHRAQKTRIVTAELKNDAGIVGAALDVALHHKLAK